MNPDDLNDVMQGYYRGGSPARLLEVLRQLVDDQVAKLPPEQRALQVTFFAAAARGDATVASGVRALRDAAVSAGRAFLDEVLAEAGRPARRVPVATATDLDVRWSEFFATGDLAPIGEILAVLSWPERLRAHLTRLFTERRWTDVFGGADSRRAALAERLRGVGFRVDEAGTIGNAADLDCLAILRGIHTDPDKVKRLQAALPSPLGMPELLYMSTKTAALWSLASNGVRHEPVFDACARALARAEGPARFSLLVVVGNARLARGEYAEALKLAEAALAVEPDDEGSLALRSEAGEGVAIASVKALLARTPEEGEAVDDPASLRALARSHAPPAFRVLARVREAGKPGNPAADGLTAAWDVTFRGDRSKGLRWFWSPEENSALADQWVTVGSAHYENPGLWVRFPDGLRANEQRALQREHFLALLTRAPAAARRHAAPAGEHLALRYDDAELGALAPVATLPGGRGDVTLWIRAADGALVGAVVTAGDVDAPWLQCVYLGEDAAPMIEVPEEFVDARQGMRTVGRA